MSHLSIVWYLLVTVLLLGGLLIDLLRTVIRQMTFLSTMETFGGSIRSTSLHWSVVRGILTLILVPILLWRAVIVVLQLIRRTLQELITWRKLTTIPLVRWIPLLIALLKINALASLVSRYLSLKPLPFGIHLLVLVIHHNNVIH
jgi:hypothetical protein